MLTRLWWWVMMSMVSPSHLALCSGIDMVVTRVYTRRELKVKHQQYPASILFREMTSFQEKSSWPSRGRKTVSREWNSAR